MKLQQLRYVCEIVTRGLNVTRAARELHTSQPGVSRHVRLLEEELGVQIFVRDQKRIASLTPIGAALFRVAQRVVNDIENLRSMANEYRTGEVGDFTVATSHTHARYFLPPVIERFALRYPKVRLRLRQGLVPQVCRWLSTGDAQISISTQPDEVFSDIAFLPCHELHRIVLTLPEHPILKKRNATLHDLANYPIITYDYEFKARAQIEDAFSKQGLRPNVVLSATDADTMKTYVQSGLGIAIVANTTFDRKRDQGLRAVSVQHLFPSSQVVIGLRRYTHLPAYILHFIELVAPKLRAELVTEAVNSSDKAAAGFALPASRAGRMVESAQASAEHAVSKRTAKRKR